MIYDRIKKLLPEQYKSTENLNKIIQFFSEEFDTLEIVFNDIKNVLNIDDAEGAQLDLIGKIIVEDREGRNDDDYRNGIRFKIFENTSKGFVEDIIKVIKFITGGTVIIYSDNPPAAYTIYTNGTNLPSNLNFLIDQLTAAGVGLNIFASDGETPFIFTEIAYALDNLIDNLNDPIIDNLNDPIAINVEVVDTILQQIYGGIGMGTIQSILLTNDLGEVIIDDQGEDIVVADPDQNIIESGKMSLIY